MKKILISIIAVLLLADSSSASRIKDIAHFKGIRSNQLVGYGLVVGLDGSGDKGGSIYTSQALSNMFKKMGLNISKDQLKPKNVAAVMVTATLPPFARTGDKLDITVSSVGDAKSLFGGTLLMTPLKGADSNVYALAQGPVAIGGYSSGGQNAGTTKNYLLVGKIPDGAYVEREVKTDLNGRSELMLSLDSPDFTTAVNVSDSINKKLDGKLAVPVDSGGIHIKIPGEFKNNVASFIASIENIEADTDSTAKIIVNEKTGTIVIGENVSIETVALTHGNLSITIKNEQNVSQPSGINGGNTVVTNNTNLNVSEEKNKVMMINKTSTIGDLAKALNAIGVTPRDMISIFQALKKAGALHAKLEII